MKKEPKRLYGYWDGKGEDMYFGTYEDPDDAVATGETRKVGVYELVGHAQIKNSTETTVTPIKVRT